MRARGGVGDGESEGGVEAVEFCGGVPVDGGFDVVLRLVVAAGVPVAVDDFFGRAFVVAEDEAGDGDADADEVVVVGAAEEVAFGFEVGADFDFEWCGDGADGFAEGGVGEALHGEDVEGEDGAELVEIQVGDDVFFGDGEVLREVGGAEEAFFFAGEDAEEEGAGGGFVLKVFGEFDEESDVGGVVEGAVVEVVAENGSAVTVAVEVGGEGDVFGGEFGIGTGEDGEDVGGGDVFAGGGEADAGGEIEGEGCEWSSLASAVTMSEGVWPDAAKRALREAGLMRMRMGALAFGAGVPAMRDAASVGGGPVEGFDGGWVVDGEDGGNPCLREGAKAAAGVGFAFGWCKVCGGVVEEDYDFAFEVEIVPGAFRSRGRSWGLRQATIVRAGRW